jgi:hypothetical protein
VLVILKKINKNCPQHLNSKKALKTWDFLPITAKIVVATTLYIYDYFWNQAIAPLIIRKKKEKEKKKKPPTCLQGYLKRWKTTFTKEKRVCTCKSRR